MTILALDKKLIAFFRQAFLPLARMALFVIFFWFGGLKLLGLSPASPLATALTSNTVGMNYFDILFTILALIECAIGMLFLFPKMTRVVVPLLLIHMLVVSAPIIFVPNLVWQNWFVPTLEGQYILKNLVVVALAIGVAAQIKPLNKVS